LVSYGCKLECIDIANPDLDGYDKEYVINIVNDEEIWAEPMWHEAYYENGELMREARYIDISDREIASKAYVHSDCSSKVIPYIHSNDISEFSYCEDDYDCLEDEEALKIDLSDKNFSDVIECLLSLWSIKDNFDYIAANDKLFLEISYKK